VIEITLVVLLTLVAILGLPSLGIVLIHLYYYHNGLFSWQVKEQIQDTEIRSLRSKVEESNSELSRIHKKLLDSITTTEN
jgi:hypothetical protein